MRLTREIDELYPNVPDHFLELYFRSWSDYEEYGHMVIVQHTGTGQLYIQRWSYSVFGDHHDNTQEWCPWMVTEEEAIQEMIEYDESCDEHEAGFQGW
jgi:hypothetical protein